MRRNEEASYDGMKQKLKGAMEKNFRPDLNRVDDIIVFRSLNKDNLKMIIDIELEKVSKRLKDKGLKLVLSDGAKELLIDKGTSLEYGVRPLRRAIEHYLEDPLSEELLRGGFEGKDTVTATVTEGSGDERKLVFVASGERHETVAAVAVLSGKPASGATGITAGALQREIV